MEIQLRPQTKTEERIKNGSCRCSSDQSAATWRIGGVISRILNLGRLVSFKFRPLYPPPGHPLGRRLGGPQNRSERGDEKETSLLCRESNRSRPTRWPSPASWRHNECGIKFHEYFLYYYSRSMKQLISFSLSRPYDFSPSTPVLVSPLEPAQS
jgi:hypothetical protein